MKKYQPPLIRYGIGLGAVLVATLLCFVLRSRLDGQSLLVLFIPAVLVSAWFGGFRVGIVATLLGMIIGNLILFAPRGSLLVTQSTDQIRLLIFGGVGLALSLLSDIKNKALFKAQTTTEQLQYQQTELEHAYRRFQSIAHATNDAIWEWNLQTSEVWWNEGLRNLFGYAPETIGKDATWWYEHIHPADRERVVTGIHAVIDAGRVPWSDEYRYLRADGSYAYVFDRGSVLHDDHGKPLMMMGAMVDITDLRQSETRYRILTEVSPQIVWMADAAGMITYCNRYWYDYTGLSESETLGDGWLQAIDADYREELGQAWHHAARSGELWYVEIPFRRAADDMYRWYLATGKPILNDQGTIESWIGTAIDIHERKQATETVRMYEERLRLALESAYVGTWDFYPLTGVLKWDDQCKALFGLAPEAHIDYQVFLDGLHPDDRQQTDAVVQQSLAPESGGNYDIEYRTVGIDDGVERWIQAKGRAIFNDAGQAIRFIGTVLDVTQRKQLEADREQAFAREQAARQQAEDANRLKDEFLATVSHELRTPLTAILGWVQLLQRRSDDEKRRERALATIEQSARAQLQLIEDILDVSRIITGKIRLDVGSVEPIDVIEAALEAVKPAAENKQIRLQAVLDPKAGPVLGDANRLQQIIWNLLANAIKFTPKAGRVQVRLQRVNSHIEIVVSDTGQGIRAEFLPHVFDRFRQEDSTASRSHGGLGLGLAIVRHLTELHGGTAHVESPGEGQGATFCIELPLMVAALSQSSLAPVRPSLDPTEYVCPPEISGLRILVVDDEPQVRELLSTLLVDCEAEVQTCASAAEGLALLQQWHPDVLISDVGMPGEDGYRFISKVRALGPANGGAVPAMALTAYARLEDRIHAMAMGFQIHVPKPIDPDELIICVASLARRMHE